MRLNNTASLTAETAVPMLLCPAGTLLILLYPLLVPVVVYLVLLSAVLIPRASFVGPRREAVNRVALGTRLFIVR